MNLHVSLANAIKHFIADFPLQAFPFMCANKGTYGHAGGVIHALIHGIFSMGWGPTTHEEFWVLLGVDQFLHGVTYIALSYYFIKAVSP